jgi:hypothetical protein
MVFEGENREGEDGEYGNEEVVIVWKGQHMITKLMPGDEVAAIRSRHGLAEKPAAAKPKEKAEKKSEPAAEAPADKAATMEVSPATESATQ